MCIDTTGNNSECLINCSNITHRCQTYIACRIMCKCKFEDIWIKNIMNRK